MHWLKQWCCCVWKIVQRRRNIKNSLPNWYLWNCKFLFIFYSISPWTSIVLKTTTDCSISFEEVVLTCSQMLFFRSFRQKGWKDNCLKALQFTIHQIRLYKAVWENYFVLQWLESLLTLLSPQMWKCQYLVIQVMHHNFYKFSFHEIPVIYKSKFWCLRQCALYSSPPF